MKAFASMTLTRIHVEMPKYIFSFEGREQVAKTVEYDSIDEARNEAVRYLGTYLSEHPEFAGEGHWRVNVSNELRQELLHVIVATVSSRRVRQTNKKTPVD
jgi:hypothetical protein